MLAPFRLNKKVLRECEIYKMLCAATKRRHLSFHTPGHKTKGWDITELSFSDNLSAPTGCIKRAEEDIARILGAEKSFICTDGSTCGVLSILHAARALGVKKVACPQPAHKSFYNGCKLLGLQTETGVSRCAAGTSGVPLPPTEAEMAAALQKADALFLTSPDYYGNVVDLATARRLCDEAKKPLLIDGAHGGHLHFEKSLYAGGFADLWVDGVHKSLPAYTQGAVVSARDKAFADALKESVDIFRTTSPSYPIMASVEYAVKFPRAEELEREAIGYLLQNPELFHFGGDWTKVCLLAGELAFEIKEKLEEKGIFAEFCDGNVLQFYLSPATTKRQFCALKKALSPWLKRLKVAAKNSAEKSIQQIPAPTIFKKVGENTSKKWVPIEESLGKICARVCGLFPPCLPLILVGESICEEKISLLKKADSVFGLEDGKICVFAEESTAKSTDKNTEETGL